MFIVQAQTRAEERKKKYEARPADCVIEKFIITPVAGLIFKTKNRAIFLERFFGREITA